uniref:pectate lyase n=1 Tax=Lachnospira sp. TaxID=2049031 RepID=UPI003FF141A4
MEINMRRDIKKGMKKAAIGIVAATMLTVMAAPVSVLPVSAATVTRGSYDFSNMVVRRVWFNTNDPVFLIDDYERVWLDNNVNVLATGNATDAKTTSNLMAPMKNMFAYIGADYKENGDNITITMNDTTVKLKIGSSDVEINGKVTSGALTDEQIPAKVNVKEKYADYNTFLTEDYNVVYLPVAYVLNIFGADMYKDGKMSDSFYAAVPVMKTESVPSYETSSKGYGMRYDALLEGTLDVTTSVADLIVALQNEDGGFQVLPDNYEMSQKETGLGSMKDVSSVYNGATTSELKYLAKYITANKPEDSKYQDAFVKGIKYLLTTQHDNGGWSMNPGSGSGFNANIEVGNKAMTEVLTLLSDIAILNNQDYVFARKAMNVDEIKSAVEKGNDFIVKSQISNNNKKSGWATQYDKSGNVTMGHTYERESVSSYTTKDVIDYLMTIHNPSQDIKDAVESAYSWLKDVKIADKEQKVVKDTSMNNGFDVYLVDGSGTWASNYVYDKATDSYRPLYSDVDPTRADQKYVNVYELYNLDGNSVGNNKINNKDLILYSTRTTVSYYDNNLADELIATGYDEWKSYLANGFPEIPKDPADSPDNNGGSDNGNNADNSQNKDTPQTPSESGNAEVSDNNTKTGDKAPVGLLAAVLAVSGGLACISVYAVRESKKRGLIKK